MTESQAPLTEKSPMSSVTRKIDHRARVTLFDDFANQLVVIERVSDEEIRIRKAKVISNCFSLEELLDRITPENIHRGVDTGPMFGGEEL